MPETMDLGLLRAAATPPPTETLAAAWQKMQALQAQRAQQAQQLQLGKSELALRGEQVRAAQQENAMRDRDLQDAGVSADAWSRAQQRLAAANALPATATPATPATQQAQPQQVDPTAPVTPSATPATEVAPTSQASQPAKPRSLMDVYQEELANDPSGRKLSHKAAMANYEYANKLLKEQVDIGKDTAQGRNWNSEADKRDLELKREVVANALRAVKVSADPKATWDQLHTSLIRDGHLSENEAPTEFPGMDWVNNHYQALSTSGALKSDQETANTAALAPVQLAEAKSKAAMQARVTASGLMGSAANPADYAAKYATLDPAVQKFFDPPAAFGPQSVAKARLVGLNPQEQTTTTQAATNQTETARHNKIEEGQGASRIGIERGNQEIARINADPLGNLGLNKNPVGAGRGADLHGDEYLATLPPPYRARVQAIARGAEAPLTGIGASKGQGAALMSAVEQYDPTWTKDRAKIRTAFATGPDGRNIRNLNTAVVHLDRWHEAVKAMNNGTFQPGNEAYNYIASAFGAAAPANHDFVMNALAGESASALKGNATDPEIAHVLDTIQGKKLSPQQALSVTEEALRVYADKAQTFNEAYHAQAPDDPWSPILPSAAATFKRYGVDPTGKVPAGGAKAAANPFRK